MNVEETVRWVEMQGESAGWDSEIAGPMMFEVREIGGVVEPLFPAPLNETLVKLCGPMQPEAALLFLAERAEQLRVIMDQWGFQDVAAGLLGIGYRAEGYLLEVKSLDDIPARGGLKRHPDTKEVRFVHFVSRDGDRMTLMRMRGEEPKFIPEMSAGGPIPHGVSRILNSLVPETVPIAPLEGLG